jgi:hypothetical protein
MSLGIVHDKTVTLGWRELMPWLVAVLVYVVILAAGNNLLADADTYWHVTIGRWILDHHQVPHADAFSFTAFGKPWIAQEWLAQVMLAGAANLAGWTGVVALAAAAAALSFGLLTRWLAEELAPRVVLILVALTFMLVTPHLVARPHVLAWPVMTFWVMGVIRAVDRRTPPPLALLPVMVLWANLHGSFTLGLVFAVAAALEAVLAAPSGERRVVAFIWARFVVLAVIASGITPYSFESLATTWRILSLGGALSVIGEWQPADFSHFGGLEAVLLGAVALALVTGFTLSPVRALMVLGIAHLALSAARNNDVLGWLAPVLLAAPLAARFPAIRATSGETAAPHRLLAMLLVALLVPATAALSAARQYTPSPDVTPAAAVAALRQSGAHRVLNDYNLGGYLVYAGLPTFIDGRTELFGADFLLRYVRDTQLKNIPDFLKLLDDDNIDATLLMPSTPAVAFLDRQPGWQRLYADDTAVVHVRLPLRGSLNEQ